MQAWLRGNKMTYIKKLLVAPAVASVLAIGFIFPANSETTVKINAVTAFTSDSDWERGFWVFVKNVEELSDGKVEIDYIGGPDAVPPFEQIEALRSGVMDLSTNAGSYFSGTIPEGDVMKLSELTPWEERENGAHDLFTEILAEHGVHYLGRYHTPGVEFNFYVRDRIESVDDFKGQELRISPLYRPFSLAMGVVPVQLAHGEIYTALERGMIDGLGAGNVGIYEQGHHEYVNYIIEPGFYGNDQVIVMNLERWNALSKDVQDILTEAIKKTERETFELIRKIAEEERSKLLEAGLEVIELEDADRYIELAREKGWEDAIERAPENGPRLRDFLTR